MFQKKWTKLYGMTERSYTFSCRVYRSHHSKFRDRMYGRNASDGKLKGNFKVSQCVALWDRNLPKLEINKICFVQNKAHYTFFYRLSSKI